MSSKCSLAEVAEHTATANFLDRLFQNGICAHTCRHAVARLFIELPNERQTIPLPPFSLLLIVFPTPPSVIASKRKEGGGYSRFPISNNIDGSGSPAADGNAAAAVCAARQDSERNSRLRQKSWEPNSSRCCRTHAEGGGSVLAAGIGPEVAVVRRCSCFVVCGQSLTQGR